MHTIHKVREFHLAFGQPVEPTPTVPSNATRLLRFKLLLEEVMEYGRAVGIMNLCTMSQEEFEDNLKHQLEEVLIDEGHICDQVEAADALADIDYVCAGANLCHGFPAEAVVGEVHASNMSKLGEDGKPLLTPGGKVAKGPRYRKPDVAAVLRAFGGV